MTGEVKCQVCGISAELYTVAACSDEAKVPTVMANFTLCAVCAITLVDEIAHGLDDAHLDVLADAVNRRRDAREAVAPR